MRLVDTDLYRNLNDGKRSKRLINNNYFMLPKAPTNHGVVGSNPAGRPRQDETGHWLEVIVVP